MVHKAHTGTKSASQDDLIYAKAMKGRKAENQDVNDNQSAKWASLYEDIYSYETRLPKHAAECVIKSDLLGTQRK